MSDSVRAGLAAQLHSGAHADVRIRFHLERTPEQQQQQQQQVVENAAEEAAEQMVESAAGEVADKRLRFVGEPLPAHKVILTLGSTLLQAKLSNPCWQGSAATRASKGVQTEGLGSDSDDEQPAKKRRTNSNLQRSPAKSASPSDDGQQAIAVRSLPEVLVPLSSEAEVPFARQAIEFIYTGRLSADLDFEDLLRVRQQACYLGVKHCPQACDQAMLAWLQAGKEQGQQQQHEGAGNSAGSPAAADLRVLQAYACRFLFPEPGTSPDAASFKPVRSTLAQQLVSHFGDAVAALTRPDLYRQLLQLPAVAVRELLAADSFGTDSEDSVFLMLACWLEAHNTEETGVSAATRAELCGLVRLHRLRLFYLSFVLPAYAPFSVCSRVELACLLRYAGAGEHERTQLLEMDGKRRLSPWYCSPARRQVVPEEGRTVEWSISAQQLQQGLRDLVEGKNTVHLSACFGAPAPAVGGGVGGAATVMLAHGGLWEVKLVLDPAMPTTAGLLMGLAVPRQLGKVQGVAALTNVQLAVHSWAQGQRTAGWTGTFTSAYKIMAGGTWGWPAALKLPPAAASGAGGEGSGAAVTAAEVAAQLARWAGWLHEGKVCGSVTFPRQ